MKYHQNPSKERRSLRVALKNILWRGLRQQSRLGNVTTGVGSGILRRDPSLPTVVYPATNPHFSDFNDCLDIDQYDVSIPDRFDVSSVATAVSLGHSLRPQMSISSFNLQSVLPTSSRQFLDSKQDTKHVSERRLVPSLTSLPGMLQSGASYQASIITFHSLQPSRSTLRIQRSDQSLGSTSIHLAQPSPQLRETKHGHGHGHGLLRKKSSIGSVCQPVSSPRGRCLKPKFDQDDRRMTQSSVRFADLPVRSQASSICSDTTSSSSNNLLAIEHFSSFCVLDAVSQGCPVTATSQELRYIFDIGEQFCLNNHGCEGTSMDLVMGSDAQGNPITHLVLFSPLIIPSSGRSRFMLASLVDVTDFIHDTASLPDLCSDHLDTISEEGSEVSTPTHKFRPSPRILESTTSIGSLRSALSADDLLGGCSVAEVKTFSDQDQDDIWKILATEERKRPLRSSNTGSRTPTSNTSSVSSVDDILDDFMSSLQELYSDFFLLAKSPLDDNYYEICNVSPRVYASRDYVQGHLSKTAEQDMIELSTRLAYDEPFTILVRWGNVGLFKQLYCVPLFARVSTTWACFLVDPNMPPLWSYPMKDR